MRSMIRLAAVFVVLAMFAGCASTAKKPGEAAPGTAAQPEAGAGAQGIPQGTQQGALPASELDNPQSPLSKREIYFDFDSSLIKPEYLAIIKAHGQYLMDHPQAKIRLEGNTDERGSREYNLALGERRAQSVARVMELQGVASDQIEVVIYGEEKPVCTAHDEACWSQNRRVDIVYVDRG
jgi:peptidoglycan-associated lipoprotein